MCELMTRTDEMRPDMADPSEPAFHISSFCCSGKCVAVAFISGGGVLVRHHHGPGPTLEFSNAEWIAFVEGVRRGEFDAPGTTTAAS